MKATSRAFIHSSRLALRESGLLANCTLARGTNCPSQKFPMGTNSSVKSYAGVAQAADKSNTTAEAKRINISAPYIARSATKPVPACNIKTAALPYLAQIC